MKLHLKGLRPELQIFKIIISIILISLSFRAHSQVLKGKIIDAENKKPVFYATVYINGSFVATYSDQQGQFELDITGYRSMPIIISALGYYTFTLNTFDHGKILTILLKPKVFELDEIFVTAAGGKKSRRQRERNLHEFKSVFIGETLNSGKCEIQNEDDIRFQFSSNDDTMKVFAMNPIIIRNNALGYTVTYFLDSFSYCESDKLLDMKGNILFSEDLSMNNREKKMIEKRRIRAYIGSRMHFFRALYDNKIKEEEFKINEPLNVLTYEEATGQKDTSGSDELPKIVLYKHSVPETYYVDHTSKVYPSVMKLRNEFIIFKKNGYFDGAAVIWEGEMAKQRIGDWLPFEYQPDF